MTATAHIHVDTAGLPYSVEDLPASGIGYLDRPAALAVHNPHGSDKLVRVKSIALLEQVARTTTGITAMTLQRITAMSGGQTVAPIPMDTSSTAIPSQVLVQLRPGGITTTGATLQTRLQRPNNLGLTRGFGVPATGIGAAPWSSSGGLDAGLLFAATFADVQGQVLREGEGIALLTSSVMGQAGCYQLIVHLQIGSDTHILSAPVYPTAAAPVFGVLNGTGSGVVVTVVRVELAEIRTAPSLAAWEMHTIGGCYEGQPVAPTWMDTGDTDADLGDVMVRVGAGVVLANRDAVATARARVGDIPFRRAAYAPLGVGVALAALDVGRRFGRALLWAARGADSDIVLREGEGLAIVQRFDANASGGAYQIEAVITVEDTSTGGGGSGGAFAFAFAG